MSVRKLGLVLAVACAALLVVPVAASAQGTPTPISVKNFSHIPITGTVTGTGQGTSVKTFSGHFNVSKFISKGNKTYALGTLTGKLGSRSISRSNVLIPVTQGSGATTGHKVASPAATCPVLSLTLGPLHLNLLGLHVDTNTIVLNITAVSGPGNLLGNLLCSVANLLNGPALPTSQLTTLLNILQQILGGLGILGL